ncbi:MAG: HlyC/CorC family transporter [Ruminococcaceae bacterium]|nr:HlyC/CorC family transporter [Oscillospiraceae bacterium]
MKWLLYVFLVFLVACSAFFSSSEIAFATMNKIRLEKKAEEGSRSAKIAVYIFDHFSHFLSTVLVGNNLVNIAFSSAMTVICLELFTENASLYTTLITTVILLIFGEICPKIIATVVADKWVLVIAIPLRILMFVFSPVVVLVSWIVQKIEPLWTPKDGENNYTDEDLVSMVEAIEDEGVITEREGDLIKSAIEFSDIMAQEILIPRVDIAAFDIDDDISELLQDEERMSYSRIPVYEESVDNIIGVISTKRLIKRVLIDGVENLNLREHLSPVLFVHQTKSVSDILLELREKNLHMAVVIDEFGGTMGILTSEDIMEEVVGDIYDESDDVEQDVVPSGENVFTVDGSMNIEDMFETVEFEPKDFDTEYTTVGGWAMEMLDKLPDEGDSFTYDRLTVTVTEVDDKRVESLRVEIEPLPEEEEED